MKGNLQLFFIFLNFRAMSPKQSRVVVSFLLVTAFVVGGIAQSSERIPRTLFYDHQGKKVSNNEFVDIRMANFHYPDATIKKILDDGTVEFWLQKIPQEGMSAPAFSLKTLNGQSIDLGHLKGKVVVLNFWFIGCSVCRAHKPKLNELREKVGRDADVVFLALTADSGGEVKKYLEREPFTYLQAADADAALKLFRFSGYPKNIVISKTGEIVYWRSTVHAWDKFESVIRSELAK